jgi:hypothetical protein
MYAFANGIAEEVRRNGSSPAGMSVQYGDNPILIERDTSQMYVWVYHLR